MAPKYINDLLLGYSCGPSLIDALGLSGQYVRSVSLHIDHDNALYAKVNMFLTTDQLTAIAKVLERQAKEGDGE